MEASLEQAHSTSRPEPPEGQSPVLEPSPAAGPIWIGFTCLEEWAQAVDPLRPVLATPLVQRAGETGPIQVDELKVVCQQVAADGTVLYCRLRAASLSRCYGDPFDPDWREREAAWCSLWVAVQKYLADQSLTVHSATVAWPRGHVFLEGRARGIAFDKAIQRYQRVPDPNGDEPTE